MIAIYKITNTVNGMVYVGQTRRSMQDRLKAHWHDTHKEYRRHKLQKAMLENGKDKFTIEQIDSAETKTQANIKEMYWIKVFDSVKTGYNSGKGGKYSKPARKVINVSTKMIFEDINEAAKVMGCSPNAIRQAIKYNYRCCGVHWKFLC